MSQLQIDDDATIIIKRFRERGLSGSEAIKEMYKNQKSQEDRIYEKFEELKNDLKVATGAPVCGVIELFRIAFMKSVKAKNMTRLEEAIKTLLESMNWMEDK